MLLFAVPLAALLIPACALPRARGDAPLFPPTFLATLQQAASAQASGDGETTRQLLGHAQQLAPDHGQVLYMLAREEARAGRPSEALSLLHRLAEQGTTHDIRADTGFAALRHHDSIAFAGSATRLLAAATPLVRSDTLRVLDDADYIPEGIAWDPNAQEFFVGSLHRGSVIRVGVDGTEQAFLPRVHDGAAWVVGVKVDSVRRVLWLASLVTDGSAPRHANGGGGYAFLSGYSLPEGQLLTRVAAPDSSRAHLLNDLAVTPTGDVYVTDTEAHAVYRLRNGANALEIVFAGDRQMHYPNGIALDAERGLLYVAHLEGISVTSINERLPRLIRLPRTAGTPANGIDGLYHCAGALYAVQKRYQFQQVTRFTLSPDGRRITGDSALERRHPIHDWATTGAFSHGDFFYIANAQLRRLAPDGSISPPTLAGRSTILRLADACPVGT